MMVRFHKKTPFKEYAVALDSRIVPPAWCTALISMFFVCLVATDALGAADAAGAERVGKDSVETPSTKPNEDWPMHGRTAYEDRFSPLSEIDRNSVSRLGLAWSYATGSNRGLEATPLVIDGVLYATASWSIVFALDAKTGRELWRHDPKVPGWKARHACCGVVNRGVAHSNGRARSTVD